MVRVAVSGAAGNIGSTAVEAFQNGKYDVTPITHREHEGMDSVVLNVEDRDAFVEALAGHDAVVHLAGRADPTASWEDVLRTNIEGTYSAFEAALVNDLDRLVFASSNHFHGMINIDESDRPETLTATPQAVYPDDPMRPDSYYGVSKVTGEALGSYYADRHGLEVVNLRIGWFLTEAELEERLSEPENVARFARAIWLSPRDCRHAVRRAVEASLPENPLSVNLTSDNERRYFSLARTISSLGYHPEDDSSSVV
jgi:L-arabinose 1-dehydrogenase [NAD(P)+]